MQSSLIDIAEWIDRFGIDLIGSEALAERDPVRGESCSVAFATPADAAWAPAPHLLQ